MAKKRSADYRRKKKRLAIAAWVLAGLALAACGVLLVNGCRAKQLVEDDGYTPQQRDAAVDVSAFAGMTETFPVQRYAAKYVNVDAAPLIYYVFGMADDVSVYNESYEGELITEVTSTWTSESQENKYLFCMQYGELYFERGDVFAQDAAPGVSDEKADEIIREALSMHGVKTDNLIFGGDASDVFFSENKGTYYYYLKPVGDIPMSVYTLGVFAMVSEGDLVALSYTNLDDSLAPTGQPQTILSARDAAAHIYDIEQADLNMYGDLVFTKAQLVYDAVRVGGNADKAVLTPIWEFTAENGTVFQVDAITGKALDGRILHFFTEEQWNGEW